MKCKCFGQKKSKILSILQSKRTCIHALTLCLNANSKLSLSCMIMKGVLLRLNVILYNIVVGDDVPNVLKKLLLILFFHSFRFC